MFDADVTLWEKLGKAKENTERRQIVAGLINYPWNRIIDTDLLHDEDIFFGPTVVHNDIPYHWHSIVAARNIGHSDAVVCTHRKFNNREQITNISDHRRLTVFEALRYTQDRLTSYRTFGDIKSTWFAFSKQVIDWGRTRIPEDMGEVYGARERNFLETLKAVE